MRLLISTILVGLLSGCGSNISTPVVTKNQAMTKTQKKEIQIEGKRFVVVGTYLNDINHPALKDNENEHFINQVCANAKMQLAQIIDDHDLIHYGQLNTKYIKVVRVKDKKDLLNLNKEYYLVDAFVDAFGGEGKRIALEWFENLDCSRFIIAGGLTSENLKELDGYGFYGVDVSSGVESEIRGKKDKQKMISFVKEANEIK